MGCRPQQVDLRRLGLIRRRGAGLLRAAGGGQIRAERVDFRLGRARLHGTGRAVLPGDPGFDEVAAAFTAPLPGALRSIITVTVDRVSDSCGFGVPIILRYVLELCRDTQDAVEALHRVPSHMAYSIGVPPSFTVIDAW